MRKFAKKIYEAAPFKRRVFTVLKQVWIPGEHIYRHLHFNGDFDVSVDSQHSFKVRHFGFEVENTLFWEGLLGGWESTALRVWTQLARDAKVVFDVGANTGIYSLIAKAVNEKADVYALEPVKRVYEKLVINNELNGFDLKCLDVAASDEDGVAEIFDFPGNHTYSTTFHREIFSDDRLVPVEVKVKRLESLINERRIEQVDLMKIDVEGHEPAVLEGLGGYLEKFAPTMIVEVLTDEIGTKIESILHGKDYKYFYLDEQESTIHEVKHLTRRQSYNYLICAMQVGAKLL